MTKAPLPLFATQTLRKYWCLGSLMQGTPAQLWRCMQQLTLKVSDHGELMAMRDDYAPRVCP